MSGNTERVWTATQLKVQDWFALPKYDRFPPTQELLADSVGITSKTITRWKAKPGWNEAVNALARARLGQHIPEIYGALVREAEKGSIQHIRTALELTGELTQLGTEGNEIQMVVRVKWDDATDDSD